MKKMTLHKIVLILLINSFPKLFERYFNEYKEIKKTFFKKDK